MNNIRLAKTGVPFASEAAAKAAINREGLDKNVNVVAKYQGGWAIVNVSGILSGKEDASHVSENQKKQKQAMKYHRVRWHGRRHQNDEENVVLSCDGQVLIWQREKEVIVPESHLEIARHSFHHSYRTIPGSMRKEQAGKVYTYGWDMLGESSEEEFKAMLRGEELEPIQESHSSL